MSKTQQIIETPVAGVFPEPVSEMQRRSSWLSNKFTENSCNGANENMNIWVPNYLKWRKFEREMQITQDCGKHSLGEGVKALSTVEEWKEASRARSTSSAVIGSCFSSTATRSCSSSLSSSSSSEAMSEAPPQHRPRWSCTSVSSTLFNFYPNSKKKSQMPLWSLSRALCALLVHSKLLLKAKLSIWGLTQDSPRSHS